jgi:hypothetical protein
MYIFIDESGTLPDPRDKYIAIAGVSARDLKKVENIISRVLFSLRQQKTNLKEIKFYYAGQNTKRQFLSSLVATDLKIFVIIIEKQGRKIPDTP